jgi:hypothetical protein
MNYEENIGRKVMKVQARKGLINKKKFKSGLYFNTVKGIINHPILNIPAYVFEEDESYVECRRCRPVKQEAIERKRKAGVEFAKKKFNPPKKIKLTPEEKQIKAEKQPTHEVVDLVYHEDEGNTAFQGTQQECEDWKSEQGFGYQIKPIIRK